MRGWRGLVFCIARGDQSTSDSVRVFPCVSVADWILSAFIGGEKQDKAERFLNSIRVYLRLSAVDPCA
jgi:hypothetical protein